MQHGVAGRSVEHCTETRRACTACCLHPAPRTRRSRRPSGPTAWFNVQIVRRATRPRTIRRLRLRSSFLARRTDEGAGEADRRQSVGRTRSEDDFVGTAPPAGVTCGHSISARRTATTVKAAIRNTTLALTYADGTTSNLRLGASASADAFCWAARGFAGNLELSGATKFA